MDGTCVCPTLGVVCNFVLLERETENKEKKEGWRFEIVGFPTLQSFCTTMIYGVVVCVCVCDPYTCTHKHTHNRGTSPKNKQTCCDHSREVTVRVPRTTLHKKKK